MLRLLSTLIVCVACSSFAGPASPHHTIALSGTDISLDELRDSTGLVGLSVAVINDYGIIASGQSGTRRSDADTPVDAHTVFSTASISKPITATIALMLVEKGVIELDAPVNQYLTRWKLAGNALTQSHPVTLRHLLSHTAGTTQSGFADFYEGETIPTLIDSLNGEKLPRYHEPVKVVTVPGATWNYSGGGYSIVQLLLEEITGKPLDKLADEMLFAPLGMTDTTMRQPDSADFSDNAARVHDEAGKVISTGLPICPQLAASGVWSTPSDLARFLIDYQRALAGKSSRVISPWVAKSATDVVTLQVTGGWSKGWMRFEADGNLDWFSHGGSNTGTGGHIMATMEGGKGLVMLANGPTAQRMPVFIKFREQAVAAMDWAVPLVHKKAPENSIKELEGTYLSTVTGDEITLSARNGALILDGQINPWDLPVSTTLAYQGEGKFALDNYPNLLSHATHPQNKQDYIALSRKGVDETVLALMRLKDGEISPFETAKQGTAAQTLSAFKHWAETYPDIPLVNPSRMNGAGYQAMSQHKVQEAENLFTAQVALFPENINAYDSLAEFYLSEKEWAKAGKVITDGLNIQPKHEGLRAKQVALSAEHHKS